MKVISLINCTGIGYEDFKKDEIRDLSKEVVEKLINFNYVKEIKDEIEDNEEKTKKTKKPKHSTTE